MHVYLLSIYEYMVIAYKCCIIDTGIWVLDINYINLMFWNGSKINSPSAIIRGQRSVLQYFVWDFQKYTKFLFE